MSELLYGLINVVVVLSLLIYLIMIPALREFEEQYRIKKNKNKLGNDLKYIINNKSKLKLTNNFSHYYTFELDNEYYITYYSNSKIIYFNGMMLWDHEVKTIEPILKELIGVTICGTKTSKVE